MGVLERFYKKTRRETTGCLIWTRRVNGGSRLRVRKIVQRKSTAFQVDLRSLGGGRPRFATRQAAERVRDFIQRLTKTAAAS